ncbi:hypothetical protein [Nonomuraea sp. NPDC050691]|uniref:hypothetical protein n=1 Tax=Nonomuraea sp. NPDC050691 TaxID=3155661 RepID=UPI0033F80F08
MADVRSVHTLLQRYDQHLAQLEKLRALLHDRLGAALSLGDHRRAATVEAALERMDRGLYGVCRRCGALIAFDTSPSATPSLRWPSARTEDV